MGIKENWVKENNFGCGHLIYDTNFIWHQKLQRLSLFQFHFPVADFKKNDWLIL